MTKKKKAFIVYVAASVLAFVISFIPTYTYCYFAANVRGADSDGSCIVAIGEWTTATNADVIGRLMAEDRRFSDGTNTIYNLNLESQYVAPSATPVAGDVLVIKLASGNILVAAVASALGSDIDLSTFEGFQSALYAADSKLNIVSDTGLDKVIDTWVETNDYHVGYAPVEFEGSLYYSRNSFDKNEFLSSVSTMSTSAVAARIDSSSGVGGVPAANEYWFKLSDDFSWIPQSYPEGYFVKYGTDENGKDVYYRAESRTNPGDVPDAVSDVWFAVPDWDPDEVVPTYPDGKPYTVNQSVVKHNGKYYVAATSSAGNNTPGTNSAWGEAVYWNDTVSVRDWSADVVYTSADPKIVRYVIDGSQRYFNNIQYASGADIPGISAAWKEIYKWEGSLSAENWDSARTYGSGFFFVSHEIDGVTKYFTNKYWVGAGYVPGSHDVWYEIKEWGSVASYPIVHQNNNPYAYTYTVSGDSSVMFWSSDAAAGYIKDETPESNPDWTLASREYSSGRYAYTEEDGVLYFWKSKADTTVKPSESASEWDWYSIPCTASYVYTNFGGALRFWINGNTSGSTQRPSVTAADWTGITLATSEYVYAVTDGEVKFWITPAHSNSDRWFELDPKWLGGVDDGMLKFEWKEHNFYQPGDIVVYGSTLTNVHRYFKLRETNLSTGLPVDTDETRGIDPMSEEGANIWEVVVLR